MQQAILKFYIVESVYMYIVHSSDQMGEVKKNPQSSNYGTCIQKSQNMILLCT